MRVAMWASWLLMLRRASCSANREQGHEKAQNTHTKSATCVYSFEPSRVLLPLAPLKTPLAPFKISSATQPRCDAKPIWNTMVVLWCPRRAWNCSLPAFRPIIYPRTLWLARLQAKFISLVLGFLPQWEYLIIVFETSFLCVLLRTDSKYSTSIWFYFSFLPSLFRSPLVCVLHGNLWCNAEKIAWRRKASDRLFHNG